MRLKNRTSTRILGDTLRMNASTARSLTSQDCPSGASASGCTVALAPSSAHEELRADRLASTARAHMLIAFTGLGTQSQSNATSKCTPTDLQITFPSLDREEQDTSTASANQPNSASKIIQRRH